MVSTALKRPILAFPGVLEAYWTQEDAGLESCRPDVPASVELAATYAALILADDGIEITADKITALTNAANIEVEPIWASLLAKALEGKNVKDLLSNVGAGGAGPATAAAPAAGGAGAAEAEAPKEEKKEEEKEESDDDMGFGLFD
ncbi:60S acidic ribosomal protein P1 [Trametes pubescens]|uniref:60S acidic ribosomal protein P1 n=1 Tax=Trametes pubescens TaxID=154538 RepID=A0A1M2VJQ0_TRAPU|nr:60S acidic ribosomal protein P1 [Trametes pubescens]